MMVRRASKHANSSCQQQLQRRTANSSYCSVKMGACNRSYNRSWKLTDKKRKEANTKTSCLNDRQTASASWWHWDMRTLGAGVAAEWRCRVRQLDKWTVRQHYELVADVLHVCQLANVVCCWTLLMVVSFWRWWAPPLSRKWQLLDLLVGDGGSCRRLKTEDWHCLIYV